MQSRVHPTYKTKYRVANWASYDRALVGRGDVTVWLAPEAIDAWAPGRVGTRGGQFKYSDLAIETALTLRLIFHLPLRQAEGFLNSLFGMMSIDRSAPDHTTLSRRSSTSTSRFVEFRPTNACLSSSTARASRLWAKVNGPPGNTADAASEAGSSSLWVSTDRESSSPKP